MLEIKRLHDDLGIICYDLGLDIDNQADCQIAMMAEVLSYRVGMVTFADVPAEAIYSEYSKEYEGIESIYSILQFAFVHCLAPEVFMWLLRQHGRPLED